MWYPHGRSKHDRHECPYPAIMQANNRYIVLVVPFNRFKRRKESLNFKIKSFFMLLNNLYLKLYVHFIFILM